MDARISDWLSEILGPSFLWVRSLSFGITSELDLLEANGEFVVLRRYSDPGFIDRHPSLITDEVSVLELAGTVLEDMAPRPIAFDSAGMLTGQPVLLMTYLRGAPVVHDLDPVQLVGPLTRLHSAQGEDLPPFHHWFDRDRMRVPDWTSTPRVWRRLTELVSSPEPHSPVAFLHRDYHPGNLLWDGGRLTGIVDWAFGCRGPIAVDVAHTRCNLMMIDGSEAAQRFLFEYKKVNPSYEHHAWWDAAELLTWDDEFSGVTALNAFGAELDLDILRQRVDAFAQMICQHADETA